MCLGNPLAHGAVVAQMLGDDALATFGSDLAVPYAFGINNHPRAAAAHAKAGGFCTEGGDTQIFQPRLEKLPGGEAVGGRATVRTDAEENVTLRRRDIHFGEAGGDGRVGHFFSGAEGGGSW